MATTNSDRARAAGGWLAAQWKRDPLWASVMAFGAVMGVLYVIGPGGQATVMKALHNVGRDPVATMQALGAGAALSLAALAGLLHFFPPTHDLGDRMLRGLLKGLIVLFVAVPLGSWAIAHTADISKVLAGFQPSGTGR
ncbi:MAG TPA: hypothetical protein VOB72_23075 [Candidatus Dormibacteraeota bacterium]|nr:hypothetical protein [Candidatus Dormibacteraeota bacterium]